MRIGELDQYVILQSLVEVNDSGELSRSWLTVGTVAARVITERGTEAFEAARINARATIRVLVRYRDDVTTQWRIEWMGEHYGITAVDRSERREGKLWITAQLVGAA